MAEAQNNDKILHRKEWQTMQPCPTATAATVIGVVINDNANMNRFSLEVMSATVHYLYDHENDAHLPIPSGAFTPAIGAGACGCYCDWSPTFTANGGSTTTVTVALNTHNINGYVVGSTIEFLSGTAANIGLRRTITAVSNSGVAGSTITLTFDTAVTTVVSTDTFRLSSGSFFFFIGGVLANSFKRFDIATMSWGSFLSVSGVSTTFDTDGRMATAGMVGVSYDTGTANADSSTTLLECDGDTSVFAIEGDENTILLIGDASVDTYKYSISAGTWSTISVTAARGAAPGAGASFDFVGKTGNTAWADITAIQDGRYYYSFRGAGTTTLHRLSINGGTSGAYTWETVTYGPVLQTFTTGAGSDWDAGTPDIYIGKEGTASVPQRFYKLDVTNNMLIAITDDWYLGGAALIGNKMWIRALSSANIVKWLYVLQSTAQTVRRVMLF